MTGQRLSVCLLLLACAASGQVSMSVVSSATYAGGALAPGMIATAFTSAAGAGLSITVRDSAGGANPASIVAAVSGQISFVVPAGAALGNATAVLSRDNQVLATAPARIAAVAPGLYSANADGAGAPAGHLLRIDASGNRELRDLFLADSKGRFLPQPFDLADASSQYFLLLFGTGFRSSSNATARIGAVPVPVSGAAAQGEYPGLDQVNLGPLPRAAVSMLGGIDVRLAFDGVDANSVMISTSMPGSGQWGRRSSLPLANSEMGVAALDGRIYVIGGYPASRVTSPAVQVYDPEADTWTLAAPLPAPVNHMMPAVSGGKLYVIGGQSDSGNASFVDTVFEYDPASNTWRTRAPLPRPRGGGVAAVVDGKIYVAGGRPPRGADFAVYDPAADRWTALPDLPTQRNHLAAAGVNGKVYILGGRFEGGFQSQVTDAVEIYDPVSGAWSRGAPMPRPRGGLNAVEAYGCIHTFGGEGNASSPIGMFADHDVYDPAANRWISLDPMPIPVHGVTGLAFRAGLIYLPGGGISQGGSSGGTQHQVYRPDLNCR